MNITRIGKYEVLEKIGLGGFGTIYRGRDPYIKREVAIKTCHSGEEEIKQRFFKEAEYAGNLQHQNICTIYDFGVEDGIPYIVLEYLGGEDLDQKIKRRDPISIDAKISYLVGICDALAYAHSRGIVHRDMKPSNVRILEDGSAKIMDFGIAKSMQVVSNLTEAGMTVGTAAYLSPEQIKGDGVTAQTDIFSLGVLMYELFSHVRPFQSEHIPSLFYKILTEEPEPLSSLAPEIPRDIELCIEKALRKEMKERYQKVEDLAHDLRAILKKRHSAQDSDTGAFAQTGSSHHVPVRDETQAFAQSAVESPDRTAEPATSAPAAVEERARAWLATANAALQEVAANHPAEAVVPSADRDEIEGAAEAADDPSLYVPLEFPTLTGVSGMMTGSLRERAVPSIFKEIHEKKLSGALHLERRRGQRIVYFIDGEVKSAVSNLKQQRTGQYLMDQKMIAEEALNKAMEKTGHGKRLGKVLVEEGALTALELDRQLLRLVRHIISSAFGWEHGKYRFVAGTEPVAADVRINLSTAEIMLTSCREITHEAVIDRGLPDLASVLQLSDQPPRIEHTTLSPTEAFVLSRIDGITPIGPLLKLIPLPEADAKRTLYALFACGILRERIAKPASTAAPITPVAKSMPAPFQPPLGSPVAGRSSGVPQARPQLPQPPPAPAPRPQVPPPAQPPQQVSPPALPADPKAAALLEKFAAYAALKAGQQSKGKIPETPVAPAPEPDKAETSQHRQARRDKIERLFRKLEDTNYYELLDVPRRGTQHEIRLSYQHLCEQFPSDLYLRPGYSDMKTKISRIREKLDEAYAILVDTERRHRYDRGNR